MRIISNTKLIKRNARIGAVASLIGLVVLAGGLVVSFTRPDQIALAWGSLLLGFILTQVGLYFGNRWGRKPRPDEVLDNSLKGLDDRYAIYHYNSPVAHLLLGPAGLWILLPYHQSGRITYEKNRWRQRGGGFLQAYMRLFAQESLGRPDLDVGTETDAMKKFFNKFLPEITPPAINVALVMTSEKVDISVENPPNPIVQAKKLKDLIRRSAKQNALTLEVVDEIKKALPEG
jgi:hypothetical protein